MTSRLFCYNQVMNKIDYKKTLKEYYQAKQNKIATVNVPKMNFIMIDGRGDPNTSQDYIDAIQALYAVAYGIKFYCKKELGIDFSVMPLEGLWWADDMTTFTLAAKSDWLWTAMIMQPEIVDKGIFDRIIKQTKAKKNLASINKIRFESYDEGRAAQTLYVGPYADEGETIKSVHAFIDDQGGSLASTNKHHHEIYLSDPRRTDAAKLKTIIRQPY